MAVGALKGAHEGALFLPALPDHGLVLIVLGAGDRVLASFFLRRSRGGSCHGEFLLLAMFVGLFSARIAHSSSKDDETAGPSLPDNENCTKKRKYIDF